MSWDCCAQHKTFTDGHPPPGVAVPCAVQEQINRAFGLNPYGQPRYRVVWAGTRTQKRHLKFTKLDPHGNVLGEKVEWQERHRYPSMPNKERFVVERWRSPDEIGPEHEWLAKNTFWVDGEKLEPLGGYPAGGEYIKIDTIEDENERYHEPRFEYVSSVVWLYETWYLNPDTRFTEDDLRDANAREKAKKYETTLDTVHGILEPWGGRGSNRKEIGNASEIAGRGRLSEDGDGVPVLCVAAPERDGDGGDGVLHHRAMPGVRPDSRTGDGGAGEP